MSVKYADQIAEEIKKQDYNYTGTFNGEAFEKWLCETRNSKLFGLKEPKTVFPENIYYRMQNREKAFVLFTESMQVYDRKAYDEWIIRHGVLDETPRIIYMYVDTKNGRGYVVNYNKAMKSILVPEECLAVTYKEFIHEILFNQFCNFAKREYGVTVTKSYSEDGISFNNLFS